MPQSSVTAEQTTGLAGTDQAVSRLRNYVNGEWVEVGGEALQSRNPATAEVLAEIPLSDTEDVAKAVAAARGAQAAWRRKSPAARARALFKLREVLEEHHEELARLVTRDMGKTLDDASAEVGRGIESIEAASAAPHMLKGENLEGVARGVDVKLVRQPVGVVAAITPFNFPAMIPLWFLPYAVAAGNSFILKPSEQDPLTSQRIFELIDEHEVFPPGVVNLVHGAHNAVNAILDSPGIDAISFVGSAKTARYIKVRGSESGKRVQALGGAKNSMVVMPDADPNLLARGVTSSAFGAAGQRCLAGSLLVLVGSESEQDASLATVVEASSKLETGAGENPATDVCPLVTPAARERLEVEIENAVAAGGELILDGRNGGGPGGAELGPTILDRVSLDSTPVTDELFGPLLTVVRVADLESAIEFVNSSRYGNASVIFTSSGGAAREYRYGAEAGMIGVNIGVAAPIAWFPFSGWKDSIDGDLHANGKDAFEFYTRKKVVTERW